MISDALAKKLSQWTLICQTKYKDSDIMLGSGYFQETWHEYRLKNNVTQEEVFLDEASTVHELISPDFYDYLEEKVRRVLGISLDEQEEMSRVMTDWLNRIKILRGDRELKIPATEVAYKRDIVVRDVLDERDRQDEKWGEQNHDDYRWLAILSEEIGEVAQAALETEFGGKAAGRVREELVQAVAVGLAWLECIDRREAQDV